MQILVLVSNKYETSWDFSGGQLNGDLTALSIYVQTWERQIHTFFFTPDLLFGVNGAD